MKRLTISLEDSVANDLESCSRMLGYSKSSLLGVLLDVPLEELRSVLGDLPLTGEVDSPKRAKGDSLLALKAIMRDVRSELARMREAGEL